MAKVSLNKVTPIKNIDPKVINIGGEEIVVIQYLPISDKITFVETMISEVFDSTGLSSPIRTEIHFYLNLIKTYTNISITDKMMENAAKTYDLLEMNGIIATIIENIPEDEFDELFEFVNTTIKHIETYNYSILGLVKTVSADYNATQIDVNDFMNQFKEVQDSQMLQDVLTKLG